MATQNATTASNGSWLDSFMSGLGSAANIYLGYQNQKNQAELNKLQAQNNLANGNQQLAIYEAQQIRANALLWGVMGISAIVIFMIIKKVMK